MSTSENVEEKNIDSFNLTSKEGQKHLKALNEELKALNEQCSSKYSLLHGPEVNVSHADQQRILRKKKSRNDNTGDHEHKKINESNTQRKRSHILAYSSPSKKIKKTCPASSDVVENKASTSAYDSTEIDNFLEEKAWKANLSAINVKNILRYVITNEQVLAMIDQKTKMQEGTLDDNDANATFESILTRSKIRKLLQNDVKIPWPISPIKNSSPSKRLIELEFSDSETSSDEEYQPDNSLEATREEIVFSPPTSESEAKSELTANDSVEQPPDDFLEESESTIALRTRSKLPLNDTPLETIEANFVAPDITVDMYASECDDEEWKEFLGEFLRPLDATNTDAVDDDANDPEYNFLEEEEVLDVEDLRDDRAVRIPKKELHELMAELLEFTQNENNEVEDEFSNASGISSSAILMPRPNLVFEDNLDKLSELCQPEELFNFERRQLLAEQMRKHVQLLLQIFLLAADNPVFSNLRDMNKSLLVELDSFATKSETLYGRKSAFLTYNLKSALNLALNFDLKCLPTIKFPSTNKSNSNKQKISDPIMSSIVHNEAFIYPEILPICGFKAPTQFKSSFTQAEDNLLSMGLEQFSPLKEFSCWQLIHEHMIPIKTAKQILIRAKNLKSKNRDPDNPIKYFYEHNRAPPVTHKVQPFDQNLVCPLYKKKALLPDIFQTFLSEYHKIVNDKGFKQERKLLPLPAALSNSRREALLKTPEKKCEDKMTTNTATSSSSPTVRLNSLRQVSPILKKYNINVHRKTNVNMNKSRKSLPNLLPKYMIIKNNGPRALAPKTDKVVNAANSFKNDLGKQSSKEKIGQTQKEPFGTGKDVIQPTIIVTNPVNPSEQTSNQDIKSNSQTEPLNTTTEVLNKETLLKDAVVEQHKEPQLFESRDSGSEVEVDAFDDGDDTADDELADTHADNEDDLAALMVASTTIKSNPKQKYSIVKKNKQKSDQKALLAMLSCDKFEIELSTEKENAYAEAFLQRVKEVVGMNSTYENFLKTLHDFQAGNQNVAQLYKDVCSSLKEYPELCDEFVFFLFPEQALECGKLMEYLNMTKMQVFLKKLEIHFGKHPQHIHKLIRAISQVQLQDSATMDDINKTVMPLLRGQKHLIEEFLQLFPQEPVSKSRLTDFEEVYISNTEEVPYDETDYETIVNFPEHNDVYGGPECICSCHSSEKLKNQNRLRHCVECGIKFIDGRIFLQTGKVMKPCKIIFLSSDDSSAQKKENCDVTKPAEQCLSSSIISPTSSASSLSPLINSDDDKQLAPAVNNLLKTVESDDKNQVLNLLTDSVTEDAILTADGSVKKPSNHLPTDFSIFRQVISQKDDQSESAFINNLERFELYPLPSQTNASTHERSDESQSELEESRKINKWTRECDRLLLQTCQRLSATQETFEMIALHLENKTVEEVQNRFHYLMSIFAEKGLSDDREISNDEKEKK